jgi:uncharacterized membrane protein YedE/YeeE
MTELLQGFLAGIVFGFLLQKSRVLRYDKQLAALRLQDFTIVKFMLAHVVVAMVGVYLMYDLGLVKLAVKPTVLGGVVLGGLTFGLGWGIVGYCPGTAAAALGEGRLDALWAIAGMLAGAALYAEAYPWLQATVLTWGVYGPVTLPQVLGVGHWLVIGTVCGLVMALFFLLERYEAAQPTIVLHKKPLRPR